MERIECRAAADALPLRVLCLGAAPADRGTAETLRALHRLHLDGLPVRIVIACAAPAGAALRGLCRALLPEALVQCVATDLGSGKRALLAKTDVMVLPDHVEGMLFTLLEAMAAGVVVVAPRVHPVTELVADGEHGLLVPSFNAEAMHQVLARLAVDRQLLARLAGQCEAHVARNYPRLLPTDAKRALAAPVHAGGLAPRWRPPRIDPLRLGADCGRSDAPQQK